MKMFVLEYYDWVDKEWKRIPDYPEIPEDRVDKEYSALKGTRYYKKYKVRKAPAEN
jgi:hypothetical protein